MRRARWAVVFPVVLAGLSLFGVVLGLPTFLGLSHALNGWLEPIYIATGYGAAGVEHHLSFGVELGLLITSAIVAIGGIALAYFFYVVNPSIPQNLARRTRPLFSLLANKYYVDELYNVLFVQPGLNLAHGMAQGVDKLLIDSVLVDGSAKKIGWLGQQLSRLQSGYVRHYALATFIGVLIVISYFFLR